MTNKEKPCVSPHSVILKPQLLAITSSSSTVLRSIPWKTNHVLSLEQLFCPSPAYVRHLPEPRQQDHIYRRGADQRLRSLCGVAAAGRCSGRYTNEETARYVPRDVAIEVARRLLQCRGLPDEISGQRIRRNRSRGLSSHTLI
jgi:hypothetical protein